MFSAWKKKMDEKMVKKGFYNTSETSSAVKTS
jgi:hypothetical protein